MVSRWERFKCWLVYGHSWGGTGLESRTINTCTNCKVQIAGDD